MSDTDEKHTIFLVLTEEAKRELDRLTAETGLSTGQVFALALTTLRDREKLGLEIVRKEKREALQ